MERIKKKQQHWHINPDLVAAFWTFTFGFEWSPFDKLQARFATLRRTDANGLVHRTARLNWFRSASALRADERRRVKNAGDQPELLAIRWCNIWSHDECQMVRGASSACDPFKFIRLDSFQIRETELSHSPNQNACQRAGAWMVNHHWRLLAKISDSASLDSRAQPLT